MSYKSFIYCTWGFIHDIWFSRILQKLCDLWKFNSRTTISQVKCIISYWNKEGSSWKFKRELLACNRSVKISHREKHSRSRYSNRTVTLIQPLFLITHIPIQITKLWSNNLIIDSATLNSPSRLFYCSKVTCRQFS